MLRGAEAAVLLLDADASPLVCVYVCRCVGMCVCPCDAGPEEYVCALKRVCLAHTR
jgi:hypothetical protein